MAIIICPECKKEISSQATSCPHCGYPISEEITATPVTDSVLSGSYSTKSTPNLEEKTKSKKKGGCFGLILKLFGVIIVLSLILSFCGKDDSDHKTSSSPNSTVNTGETKDKKKADETKEAKATDAVDETKPVTETEENVSTEFKNALVKAEQYASLMHMSKQAIYDQLTSEYGENFPEDAAQYAIDKIEWDWNANALAKAEDYSDTMHMSKEGIYDQLTSEYGERFTKKQAQYAVDNLDADWNENALKKAQDYQETMNMSKSAIYDQLISDYGEKFTSDQAQYAVDHLE